MPVFISPFFGAHILDCPHQKQPKRPLPLLIDALLYIWQYGYSSMSSKHCWPPCGSTMVKKTITDSSEWIIPCFYAPSSRVQWLFNNNIIKQDYREKYFDRDKTVFVSILIQSAINNFSIHSNCQCIFLPRFSIQRSLTCYASSWPAA